MSEIGALNREPTELPPKVGEWFLPLATYPTTPYRYQREDYSAKTLSQQIGTLGTFEITPQWEPSAENDDPTLLLSPHVTETFPLSELRQRGNSYETRLIELFVSGPKEYKDRAFPFNLQLRLKGEDTVYETSFTTDDQDGIPRNAEGFHKQDDPAQKYIIVFPEASVTWNNVQMRIVPTEE